MMRQAATRFTSCLSYYPLSKFLLIARMKETYKPYDTEEPLDYYFYRPLASFIVKAVYNTSVTPNQLTFISLFFGILSSLFFYSSESVYIFSGILFLMISNVLDCSDGQLARKRGTAGSITGRALDGLADNLVFFSIYFFSVLKFQDIPFFKLDGAEPYEWVIWAVAFVAAVGHSMQSSFFDYYRNEYITFVIKGYRSEGVALQEIKNEMLSFKDDKGKWFDRFLLWMSYLYYKIQKASNRKHSLSEQYEMLDNFGELYKKRNRFLLKMWSALGATSHVTYVMIFVFFDRMDLYFFFEAVILNIYMLVLKICQNQVNRSMEKQLNRRQVAVDSRQ